MLIGEAKAGLAEGNLIVVAEVLGAAAVAEEVELGEDFISKGEDIVVDEMLVVAGVTEAVECFSVLSFGLDLIMQGEGLGA